MPRDEYLVTSLCAMILGSRFFRLLADRLIPCNMWSLMRRGHLCAFDPGKDNGSVPRYVFCKIMAAAVSDTEERLMERADGGRSIMAIISIADSGNL